MALVPPLPPPSPDLSHDRRGSGRAEDAEVKKENKQRAGLAPASPLPTASAPLRGRPAPARVRVHAPPRPARAAGCRENYKAWKTTVLPAPRQPLPRATPLAPPGGGDCFM